MSKKTKKLFIYPAIGLIVFIFYIIFIQLFLNNAINIAVTKSARKESIAKYDLLQNLENRYLGLLMKIKAFSRPAEVSATYNRWKLPEHVSDDIMIVAIDDKALSTIGRWPFKRSVHAGVINNLTAAKYRESIVFFDVFFTEPDLNNPGDDYLLIDAIKKNERAVFDYIGGDNQYSSAEEKTEMKETNIFHGS